MATKTVVSEFGLLEDMEVASVARDQPVVVVVSWKILRSAVWR
jgi:hypothetical protein